MPGRRSFMMAPTSTHDRNHLIEAYTDHFEVPDWQAKNARATCNVCQAHFQSGGKHNCRLCGLLFCSQCSCKYHLPDKFKKKHKPGTTRVCMSCRQSCLDAKIIADEEHAKMDPMNTYQRPPPERAYDMKTNTIHPLTSRNWVNPNTWSSKGCHLCTETNHKSCSCRLCGRLFCKDNCTTPWAGLPAAFEPPRTVDNDKSNATHTCLICRFVMFSKRPRIDETPMDPSAAKKKKKSIMLSRPSAAPRISSSRSPARKRRTQPLVNLNAGEYPTGDIQIDVVMEGKEEKVLWTVQVNAEDSLVEINEQFQDSGAAPSALFHYMCRNKGVHAEWWDIFTAKYFYPKIVLRGGTIKMPTITVTSVDATAENTEEELKKENNPYLAKKKKKKIQRKNKNGRVVSVEEAEEEAPKEVKWEFAPPCSAPGVVYHAKTFVAPAPVFVAKAKPPPIPKQKKAAPRVSRATGDPSAQLAQRARSIFGALD